MLKFAELREKLDPGFKQVKKFKAGKKKNEVIIAKKNEMIIMLCPSLWNII